MGIGYNMSMEISRLYTNLETNRYEKSHELNDENEELVDKIEDLYRLLSAINTQRDTRKDEVDFYDSPELIELVDKIRAYDETLIPKKTYSWQGEKDVNALVENLNNYIKTLTPRLSQTGMYIQQELHEGTQFYDIGTDMSKNERESRNKIISNSNVKV